MNDIENLLWAKKGEVNGRLVWLPLKNHLQDTMEVIGWLWDHWLSDGQRDYIERNVCEGYYANIECFIRFLGGIHDIGKATPAFQIQRGYAYSEDLDEYLLNRLEQAGLTGIYDLQLASRRSSHHSLAGQCILQWAGVREDIASIIGSHHGKPVDNIIICKEQAAYTANYYQVEDSQDDIHILWKNIQNGLMIWVLNESEIYDVTNLPKVSQPVQILLSGLVIMADWIASNEKYFPLFPIDQAVLLDDGNRFQKGISKWYHNLPLQVEGTEDCNQLFSSRFGFQPNVFQKVVFESINRITDPGIVIIEAPTGCGKTEMALTAAEQLAAKTDRSGIFFGLPTQATSNGIFPRIVDWLKELTQEYGKSTIRLVHGKAALNPAMNRLTENIDEDGNGKNKVSVNSWFAGRKASMLDDFVVGTVDHFLLSALKQKHLALRHLGLSKKIIVIDEVHAYDAYMQQYLSEALKWMGAYQVPVILLSATLPAEIRENLVVSYMRGRGIKKRDLIPYREALITRNYPVVTCSDGKAVVQYSNFPSQQDKIIEIHVLEQQDLYSQLKKLLINGGIAGIIVNTVKRAQTITRECRRIFGNNNVELLHANFIAQERINKEQTLMKIIGKNANRPDLKIVVGTQVIEQSLDIDFDVLFTDLCPMDLLLQRTGRLHRHNNVIRPKGLEKSTVYIMGTAKGLQFDKGSEKIYGAYLLARTQAYLPKIIHIPSDISDLVQTVYGEEVPPLEEKETEIYEEAKEQFYQMKEKKKIKAKSFRIEDPKLKVQPEKYNMIGWLKDPNNTDTEEKATAQVRDIQETIEVIAVKRRGSGYSLFDEDRDISMEINSNQKLQQKLANQTLRLPQRAVWGIGIEKVIDYLEQFNKEYLNGWQHTPWLSGQLGIIFDENNQFFIGNHILQYDNDYGLEVIERQDNELL